jgi:ABC-type uncharacterized transport system fused permease/ATPase subunit
VHAQAVFYVPQQPYTTPGTLREQVIYPLTIGQAAAAEGLGSRLAAIQALDARLDGLMAVVRLGYLVEREGGWGAAGEWGETLSLGACSLSEFPAAHLRPALRPAAGHAQACTRAASAA